MNQPDGRGERSLFFFNNNAARRVNLRGEGVLVGWMFVNLLCVLMCPFNVVDCCWACLSRFERKDDVGSHNVTTAILNLASTCSRAFCAQLSVSVF